MKKVLSISIAVLVCGFFLAAPAAVNQASAAGFDVAPAAYEISKKKKKKIKKLTKKQVEKRTLKYMKRLGKLGVKSKKIKGKNAKKLKKIIKRAKNKIASIKTDLAEIEAGNENELEMARNKIADLLSKIEWAEEAIKGFDYEEQLGTTEIEEMITKVDEKIEEVGEMIYEFQKDMHDKQGKGKDIYGEQALLDKVKDLFIEANDEFQIGKNAYYVENDKKKASEKLITALYLRNTAKALIGKIDLKHPDKPHDKDWEEDVDLYHKVEWMAKHLLERIGEYKAIAEGHEDEKEILKKMNNAEGAVQDALEELLKTGKDDEEALEQIKQDLEAAEKKVKKGKKLIGEDPNEKDEEVQEAANEMLDNVSDKLETIDEKYEKKKKKMTKKEIRTLKDLIEEAEMNMNIADAYYDVGHFELAKKHGYAAMSAAKTASKLLKGIK